MGRRENFLAQDADRVFNAQRQARSVDQHHVSSAAGAGWRHHGAGVAMPTEACVMQWMEQLSDPEELRSCIRALVAVSALPAIWNTYDSGQISDSIAAALVSMLSADFVHVALPGWREAPGVELTRTGMGIAAEAAGAIRTALQSQQLARSTGHTAEIANPWGEGTMRLSCAPIGFGREAVLVAGSHRADFPTQGQRLLLGVGANEATIALQRWQGGARKRGVSPLMRPP